MKLRNKILFPLSGCMVAAAVVVYFGSAGVLETLAIDVVSKNNSQVSLSLQSAVQRSAEAKRQIAQELAANAFVGEALGLALAGQEPQERAAVLGEASRIVQQKMASRGAKTLPQSYAIVAASGQILAADPAVSAGQAAIVGRAASEVFSTVLSSAITAVVQRGEAQTGLFATPAGLEIVGLAPVIGPKIQGAEKQTLGVVLVQAPMGALLAQLRKDFPNKQVAVLLPSSSAAAAEDQPRFEQGGQALSLATSTDPQIATRLKNLPELAGALNKSQELRQEELVLTLSPLKGAGDQTLGVMVLSSNVEALQQAISTASLWMISGLAGVVLVMILVIFLGINWVLGPLKGLTSAIEGLAEGDLNQHVEVKSQDEMGILAQAFNRMVSSQKDMAAAAESVSQGKLDIQLRPRSERDSLALALLAMVANVKKILDNFNGLAGHIQAGMLAERADSTAYSGAWAEMMQGLNKVVGALVGHLDAMPNPAIIVDKSKKIQFANKAATRMFGKSLGQVVGGSCHSECRTGDCNSERCLVDRAINAGTVVNSETYAEPDGKKIEIAYSAVPIIGDRGQALGALEVMTDLTEIRAASRASEQAYQKAKRVAAFQEKEVARLVENLGKAANGDLHLDTKVAEANDDTRQVAENFGLINKSLDGVVEAVSAMAGDARMLAQAAAEGQLETRAQADRHQGQYREIVQGVNQALEALADPIRESTQVLQRLAARDLRTRTHGQFRGDFVKLGQAIDETAASLHDAMVQVSLASQQLSSSSHEVASSSTQVAEGASSQASSLEQTSAALEQLTAMTKNNDLNAREALRMSDQAGKAAEQGDGYMTKMDGAMDQIHHAATGTAQIIKDINEIAFQTNLLALNAAVEAARAGDAGRGFAVVAEEVRALAMRSKEAAQHTEKLITESVNLAGEGQQLSGKVREGLSGIVDLVGKVRAVVAEVATASGEQAEGIDQINKAVVEMDQVVQSSAANAEESAGASEELAGQAQELDALVRRFDLDMKAIEGRAVTKALPKPELKRPPSASGQNPKAGAGSSSKAKPKGAQKNLGQAYDMSPDELIPFGDEDDDFADF